MLEMKSSVNIAGGLEVDEPAVDLGVVDQRSLRVSRTCPINAPTAVFGEVGLTGEVRGTRRPWCARAKRRH